MTLIPGIILSIINTLSAALPMLLDAVTGIVDMIVMALPKLIATHCCLDTVFYRSNREILIGAIQRSFKQQCS
jgi:hypothetical protein